MRADRQTDTKIAILHIPHAGEVIIIIVMIIILLLIIIITRSIGTVPTSAKTRLTSVAISVPPSGELVRDQHQLNEQLYSPRQRAQCKRTNIKHNKKDSMEQRISTK